MFLAGIITNSFLQEQELIKIDLGPFGTQKATANLTYATIEGGYRIPVSNKITMETSVNVNIPISPTGSDIWYGAKVGAVYQF